VQSSGSRVQGSGFRVQCSVFSVQCSGFGVQGSVLKVRDAGCWLQGPGSTSPDLISDYELKYSLSSQFKLDHCLENKQLWRVKPKVVTISRR
jgi:hypothetical protein